MQVDKGCARCMFVPLSVFGDKNAFTLVCYLVKHYEVKLDITKVSRQSFSAQPISCAYIQEHSQSLRACTSILIQTKRGIQPRRTNGMQFLAIMLKMGFTHHGTSHYADPKTLIGWPLYT
jgi:hypothetical protein